MTQMTLPDSQMRAFLDALAAAGIATPTQTHDGTTLRTLVVWTPDLSPADLATVQSIQTLLVGALLITPAERQAIDSDIQLLVAFQGIATPTLAQTAAATKSQSRILRAILRS